MDYVVGSVAALISGNVTPNRPKLMKRALTPMKHQPSPNVTPKSEFVEDRSIFLSPSLQKKKDIVKKSPKRIFQNPDLDFTNDGEGESSVISPKADKVKKHLKEELEASDIVKISPKSAKKANTKVNTSINVGTPKKNKKINVDESVTENVQISNENTPKKKKKRSFPGAEPPEIVKSDDKENLTKENEPDISPRKNKKRKSVSKSSTTIGADDNQESSTSNINNNLSPKKNKKRRKSESNTLNSTTETLPENQNTTDDKKHNNQEKKKKKKKHNKKSEMQINQTENKCQTVKKDATLEKTELTTDKKSKKQKAKNIVNPNAITNEETDSEHESDDEIESENEQANNEILDTGPVESSDDEEEKTGKKKPENELKVEKIKKDVETEEEIKRTLFVGNVPLSKKCKKEIKKIFSKYGTIETVRIRTVPVKDGRVTPKLAVIRNELHPDRSTVNVYVKFERQSSVAEALAENNTVLNDHHLRVSRSDNTGAAHDPKCSVFVGNLPFAIEDETLRGKFDKCGEILSVRIVRDRKTNAGKGFGYVNFASKDGVELALALSEEDLTIKNRILRVKRCTLTDNKQNKNKGGPVTQGGKFHARNQGGNQQGRNQGFHGRNQRDFQGNQGGFQGKPGGFQKRNQAGFQGNQGGFKENQRGSKGRSQGNAQRSQGSGNLNEQGDGAFRRIMKKRQNQESGTEGPPNKIQKVINQPKEKKARKEFVGITAEKKKKQKPNKGNKKKKALSEILTKNKP